MDTAAPRDDVQVSVIIPVYNEQENLYELRDDLFPVLTSLGESFEVLFIDDGSTDRSAEILREFYEADTRVRVIRFARNFGQQMANTAGLRHARGRAVIIMDADLQTPAEYIPRFLAKLREGYDIVYGKRQYTVGPFYRKVGSVFADLLIRKMTGFGIPGGSSGFLALNEDLVRNVNRYNEKSRYLSGLFAWLSYGRHASIPVSRPGRPRGTSHYGFLQLTRLVLNFVTSFSTRPLHFATLGGTFVAGLAAIVAARWLYVLLTRGWGAGETALYTFVLLFVAAIQLWALGIVGEYVGRIYGEVRERPPYIVSEVLDRAPANDD